MRTLYIDVDNFPSQIIGFGGENGVTAISLDYLKWAEEFGEGTMELVVKRSMDSEQYLAALTVEDNIAVLTVSDVETSYKGHGEMQYVYTVGNDIVKKSPVFGFNVNRSLDSEVIETPEAYQTWFDQLLAMSADVHEVAEQVYEATGHYPKVENGYWYIWDVTEEEWVNTEQKAQGEEGAPGVGVASTVLNADYTLTITLTDGTSYTTPSIRGATGNGIASTILNSDYTLTITFTDGTSYTTPSIRGAQGIPGQDYVITSADYDEIAGRVDTMIATERQQALDDIDTAKTNAVSDVTLEGTTQKGLVASEGTTQKGLVTSEGTTQVGLVTAKGQEVIQSIPSDYSELSDDVLSLKADFTQLEQNKADMIINSASGAIASFSDGANYPVKQTVFEMNPVQDLHGQEYPYPPGGGKNKIPLAVDTIKSINTAGTWNGNAYTFRDLTFIIQTNSAGAVDGITVNGTATSATYLDLTSELPWNEGDVINGCPSGGSSVRYGLGLRTANSNWDYGNSKTIVGNVSGKVAIWVNKELAVSNLTFKPMIRSSSVTDATFAPYENICPILGHTEVNAVRTGKNLWNPDRDDVMVGYYDMQGRFTSTSNYKCLSFPCSYGDVYTKSGAGWEGIVTYWLGNNFVSATNASTVTIPNGVDTVKFACLSASTDAQLELGSTASSYEAFNGQSVTYQLGQTVYEGTLTVNENGSGQIVADCGIFIPTENTNWYGGSQANGYRWQVDLPVSSMARTEYVNKRLSSILTVQPSVWVDGQMVLGFLTHYTMVYVRLLDETFSTKSAVQTLLAGQQFIYPLRYPVTIQLTEQEVIETLKGQNNVWCNTGDTEVTYRADTKLYIDNKIATLLSV